MPVVRLRSDPEVLGVIEREAAVRRPALRFSGSLKLGVLEIELDEDTADFLLGIIDRVRERTGKQVRIEADQPSAIGRRFLEGYFDRKRR